MICKIVDITKTDVFLNFDDGIILDVCKSSILKNTFLKNQTSIDLNYNTKIRKDKMTDFFI